MQFLDAVKTARQIVNRTGENAYVYLDGLNGYQVASMPWGQLLTRWQHQTKAIVTPTGQVFHASGFTVPVD